MVERIEDVRVHFGGGWVVGLLAALGVVSIAAVIGRGRPF